LENSVSTGPAPEIGAGLGVDCNSGLIFIRLWHTFKSMETATVILEGDRQTVRLPKSVHLPNNVFVRQDGESVVLEPSKPKSWPDGFFDSIRITDPAFERPEQGQLPPVKNL
jgi:virulence-associated protein VagC